MLTTTLAAALLCAPANPAAQTGTQTLFPQATAGLQLSVDEEGSSLTYADALDRYGELTGLTITFDVETEGLLRNGRIRLDRPIDIAAEDVTTVVETFLARADFVMTATRAGDTTILHVESLNSNRRNNLRSKALYIETSDIKAAEQHPAILFAVGVPVEHLDPRQLSNSMRTMIVDANVQMMVPAGDGGGLIVVGLGEQVAGLVRTIQEFDAQAGAKGATTQTNIEVIQLEHADALVVATTLQAVFRLPAPLSEKDLSASNSSAPRVVHDTRTNQIILNGRTPDIEEIKNLIAALDRPVD